MYQQCESNIAEKVIPVNTFRKKSSQFSRGRAQTRRNPLQMKPVQYRKKSSIGREKRARRRPAPTMTTKGRQKTRTRKRHRITA